MFSATDASAGRLAIADHSCLVVCRAPGRPKRRGGSSSSSDGAGNDSTGRDALQSLAGERPDAVVTVREVGHVAEAGRQDHLEDPLGAPGPETRPQGLEI